MRKEKEKAQILVNLHPNLKALQKVTDFTKANFEGFTLKKGFWYGYSNDGTPIATSTWTTDEGLAVYFKGKEDFWDLMFLPKEEWTTLLPEQLAKELFSAA